MWESGTAGRDDAKTVPEVWRSGKLGFNQTEWPPLHAKDNEHQQRKKKYRGGKEIIHTEELI